MEFSEFNSPGTKNSFFLFKVKKIIKKIDLKTKFWDQIHKSGLKKSRVTRVTKSQDKKIKLNLI